MIEVKGLFKSFGGQAVLKNISFAVPRGKILAVLGGSGSGKSVLLKSLMGLLKPDRGSIKIDGREITELPESELLKLRSRIGYLFQDGALYDFMNVYENIVFPLREHTALSRDEMKEKVRDILNLIDLKDVEKKFPAELSGGMRKRVALARSIILECKVLLCDEPTSGLDPIRSRDISDLIKDVSNRINCTTVITSHDIRNAFRIADQTILIRDGQITAAGDQAEMEASQNEYVREFIH